MTVSNQLADNKYHILICSNLILHTEYLPDNCSDGDVRLSHREALHRGQVQVCVNDTWGTVCSNFWDDTDASVVCRQLGFFGGGMHFTLAMICSDYCNEFFHM